jgi:ribose transport system substrate-binding protein
MTESSESQSLASPPAPRKGVNWLRDLVIILILIAAGVAVAYNAGMFHPQPKIAIITSTEDVYWDRLFEGGETAAKYFDAQLTTVKCSSDEAKQSQTIRDLLSQGVGGLIVSPVHPEAQTALLNEVAGKIPLITVDSDSPKSNRIAFIGTNNYEAGRQAADLVKDALPDGGELIVCVGSIDNDNGRSRRQAVYDALLDRAKDAQTQTDPVDQPVKAGKYTILASLIDGGDPAKAKSMAMDALKKNPNVKLFVGLWSYNTPALLDALKEAKQLGKIKIVGFDDLDATLAGVEAGNVFGTLVQDQYNMGFDSVMLMCAHLQKSNAADSRPRKATLTCTALMNAADVKMFRSDREKSASDAK